MRYLDVVRSSRTNNDRRFPRQSDSRTRATMLFPSFKPKFPLRFDGDLTVFGIGSCFARNIEEVIKTTGARLPTMAIDLPMAERHVPSARSNGILNEYTPGCIGQRIMAAMEGRKLSELTIMRNGELYSDLLLHNNARISLQRALERRQEIDAIYAELPRANVVILTLGYIETWYDNATNCYLNRKPPHVRDVVHSDRFSFERMDLTKCIEVLAPAVDALVQNGVKVIVTVSPVPLGTTFTGDDCVVANQYSKAVLLVCAKELSKKTDVDYFPSYEIVVSGGLASFKEDQIHVKDDVVAAVTHHMMEAYQSGV